uniref:C-type lectin domain-containing protein n=1 Tax=Strongyloides stercoralis TaxID=6248 RepID=A0A0K0DYD9_STRER
MSYFKFIILIGVTNLILCSLQAPSLFEQLCILYGAVTNNNIVKTLYINNICYLYVNIPKQSYNAIPAQCNQVMILANGVCSFSNIQTPENVAFFITSNLTKKLDTFFVAFFRPNCNSNWKTMIPDGIVQDYNGTWQLPSKNVDCDKQSTAVINETVVAVPSSLDTSSFLCQCALKINNTTISQTTSSIKEISTIQNIANTSTTLEYSTISNVTQIPILTTTKLASLIIFDENITIKISSYILFYFLTHF